MGIVSRLQRILSPPQAEVPQPALPPRPAETELAQPPPERIDANESVETLPDQTAIDEPTEALPAPPEGPWLNLGCGMDVREGWVNVDLHDFHHPDIVADITNLKPLADNYAGYALAQDILEHVPRDCCSTALREWNRVLKPDGLLEVRVPDVIALARLLQEPDRQTPEAQDTLLQCMFGTQRYNGDFHYNGFTELSLTHALNDAGFEVLRIAHHDGWLFQAIGRKIEHRRPDPLLRVDNDEVFIDEAYRTILHREADPGGRAHYLEKLASGIPREAILATLRAANE
ncbi:DUF4214 domain-containing protein [Lysobacter enzymogenes]|uniref:DUF4214 domain-containing protein n=1 Tax=Lysobacter enzymogenes TaxID=69 RepID=UPI001A95DB72|nr:methyltransferase domain-containing protein [Lysobacter enzymogenes]QQP98614.1 methyltransferase domain-containing protein [Lysobacter enzymogenes]